eukprot:jgi/Phyca11/20633/fgenesh1_pg.PHYCAscaffold_68_\
MCQYRLNGAHVGESNSYIFQSMGNTRSYSRSSSFEIKDALALCEDGDLLLAREKLADCTLRVGVEFVVARDIQRMQRGQFPTQRVTSLPLGAAGLQFVSFDERVASKMPNTRDCRLVKRMLERS